MSDKICDMCEVSYIVLQAGQYRQAVLYRIYYRLHITGGVLDEMGLALVVQYYLLSLLALL